MIQRTLSLEYYCSKLKCVYAHFNILLNAQNAVKYYCLFTFQENFSATVLLLQHGINQMVLFLKEFSLLKEEKEALFTHFTIDSKRNLKSSGLVKYLKASLFSLQCYSLVQKTKICTKLKYFRWD